MIGAEKMLAILSHLETIASTGDLEALGEWIPKMKEHFQILETVLMRWLEDG